MMEKRKIQKVDRYGHYTGDYMFFVHYDNGDIDQYSSENLPREVKHFMATADFQFMYSLKREEHFHRFQPYGK